MKTVLFDLDGTLLPMDMEVFMKTYLHELYLKGMQLGYDGNQLVQVVLAGVNAMVNNDGTLTNEQRFWRLFIDHFGGEMDEHIEVFEEFYANEFAKVAKAVRPTPLANEAVQVLKEKGYELVLATNPLFPRIATLERMRWAGLQPEDFVLITTYENSRFAKPNLDYYREILTTIDARAEECLMVGNDVAEDLIVAQLGIQAFLVTDDLIHADGVDYANIPQGNREEMLAYFLELPKRE
ncbi:MAG: HAD family hydrolase [Firmicutes bacterium]|nr:HAD family hydrolase [Bacillota bacterium]